MLCLLINISIFLESWINVFNFEDRALLEEWSNNLQITAMVLLLDIFFPKILMLLIADSSIETLSNIERIYLQLQKRFQSSD